MKRITLLSATLLATAGLFAAAPAWSGDEAAENTVRYRQTLLGAMGRHMGAVSMVAKGQVDRKGDVVFHAMAMHETAKALKDLFPPSTHPTKISRESEALPAIWDKPEDFAKALKMLEDNTGKLVEAAKTNDAAKIQEAFGGVGQACGNCHDAFKKDDH